MILLALMTFVIVALLSAIVWSALSEASADDKAGPAEDARRAREVARPETLEGVLVRQLLDDEISRRQYGRAMQRLAERDADRHPLTVPPEN